MQKREPPSKAGLVYSTQIQPRKQKDGGILRRQQCQRTRNHKQVGIRVEMQRFKCLRFHLEQIERLPNPRFGKQLLSVGEPQPPSLMDAAATDGIAGDNRRPF